MRLMYHVAIALVAAVLMVPIGVNANPNANASIFQDTGDCSQNCTASVRVGGVLFVVSRDASGNVFQVDQVQLSEDAELIEPRRQAESGRSIRTSSNESDGGTTETTTETYETTTEIVVVTTHLYYNADGDLVDVQTSETRFQKDLETE